MDNIDVPVEEEQVPEVSKTSEINDEVVPKTIEEETTTENEEIVEKQTENAEIVGDKNEDEIDAAPPTTTTEIVESEPIIEEQENVNGTSTIPASVSPGRSNLPFKEVNESDNDEAAVVASTATAENSNTKKRELDHEDEQPQEKTGENEERAGDQVKKLKLNEPTEASTEPKECETNNTHPITNGNSAVEV